MNRHLIKFAAFLSLTLLIVFALNSRIGMMPKIGPLFSPFEGFWQLAESSSHYTDREIRLTGLEGDVFIHYDEAGIPHIFAGNDRDLYMAQGYVTARERLWQMEFSALAASGRLTEIIGDQALDYSRYMRNLGMMIGAEHLVVNIMQDERSRVMVEAYTDGVNQYIRQLDRRKLPLEYKILGYEPEMWTPLKSALIFMNISETLSVRGHDHPMTVTLDIMGKAFIDRFFPRFSNTHSYYIPDEGQFDFEPLYATPPERLFTPKIMKESPVELPIPGAGSNNWSVHGSRTASGNPMMSNDPHLGLTLPSIWIEMQLHTPDVNTYGFTLPGAPGIVIGFNEAISWGLTNAGSDALDVYEIEFRDDTFREYLYEEEWLPVNKQLETYLMADGSAVTDTFRLTHHGPVTVAPNADPYSRFTPAGHAIRWAAHEPGNELLSIYLINRAANIVDFQQALHHFHSPSQTLSYADTSGTIGLFHHGKFPVRWEGQGDFISDGRDPAYEWQKFVPMDQTPRVINPSSGFAGSANQPPVGDYYPYRLGRLYTSNERGARIHELLSNESSVDLSFMKVMVHDNLSIDARQILPRLLEWIRPEELDDQQQAWLDTLSEWDYRYDTKSLPPYFFNRWWQGIYDEIWEDLSGLDRPASIPDKERTGIELIANPDDNLWFNDTWSNIYELTTGIYMREYDRAVETYGEPGDNWRWSVRQERSINHIAFIPGFGRSGLQPGGTPLALNAIGDLFAPSLRMIVDLSVPVQAWGIYAGGSSGNPGSYYYDNFIDNWEAGELRPLHFWRAEEEAASLYSITLSRCE